MTGRRVVLRRGTAAVTDNLINALTAEIHALTPAVEASKRGTPHEGHDGWSLAGDPHIVLCGCGEPLPWLNPSSEDPRL